MGGKREYLLESSATSAMPHTAFEDDDVLVLHGRDLSAGGVCILDRVGGYGENPSSAEQRRGNDDVDADGGGGGGCGDVDDDDNDDNASPWVWRDMAASRGGGGERDHDVRQLLLDPGVCVRSRRGHVPAVEAPAGLQWAGRHRRPSSLSGVIVVFRRSHLQILPDEGDGEVLQDRRRVCLRLCGGAVRRERTRRAHPPASASFSGS